MTNLVSLFCYFPRQYSNQRDIVSYVHDSFFYWIQKISFLLEPEARFILPNDVSTSFLFDIILSYFFNEKYDFSNI